MNHIAKLKDIIFYFYAFCLIGLMPAVITPWRKELFYDGKIVFVVNITLLYLLFFTTVKPDVSCNRKDVIIWLITGLAVLILLSTVFSIDPYLSLWGQFHSREGCISLIAYLIIFYLFYINKRNYIKLIKPIFFCVSVISLYGILQYYRLVPDISTLVKGSWERGLSTIGNQNFAGTYCTLFLPVVIGIYMYYSGKLSAFSACLIFAFLIVSRTRSGWVAFAVYFVLLLFFNIKSREKVLRWVILLILFFSIFGIMNVSKQQLFSDRAKTIITDAKNITDDSVGSQRMYYWKRTKGMLFEKPVFGYGPDTFGKVFADKYGEIKLYYEKAHNEYLQMALTLGYPALIVYLTLIGIISYRLWKNLRYNYYSQILFCCIIGYLVQALFNISVISTAPIYWAMLGMAANRRVTADV